jgi:hypothetical protein
MAYGLDWGPGFTLFLVPPMFENGDTQTMIHNGGLSPLDDRGV